MAVERVPPHLAVPRVDPPWVQVAPAPVDLPARPTRMLLVLNKDTFVGAQGDALASEVFLLAFTYRSRIPGK